MRPPGPPTSMRPAPIGPGRDARLRLGTPVEDDAAALHPLESAVGLHHRIGWTHQQPAAWSQGAIELIYRLFDHRPGQVDGDVPADDRVHPQRAYRLGRLGCQVVAGEAHCPRPGLARRVAIARLREVAFPLIGAELPDGPLAVARMPRQRQRCLAEIGAEDIQCRPCSGRPARGGCYQHCERVRLFAGRAAGAPQADRSHSRTLVRDDQWLDRLVAQQIQLRLVTEERGLADHHLLAKHRQLGLTPWPGEPFPVGLVGQTEAAEASAEERTKRGQHRRGGCQAGSHLQERRHPLRQIGCDRSKGHTVLRHSARQSPAHRSTPHWCPASAARAGSSSTRSPSCIAPTTPDPKAASTGWIAAPW